jgi:hypothetical protein
MTDANAERARNNSLKAVETIRTLLTEMDLKPVEESLPSGIALRVTLDGPADEGVAQVLTDAERFVFHFAFPGTVDPSRRGAVADYIARANWALIEGNFELNVETGALRYKVGIDFTHTELTEPLVRNAILSGMNNIELYVAGLEAVRDSTLDPKDAYQVYAPALSTPPH